MRVLLALIVILAPLSAFFTIGATPAFACSMIAVPDPNQRLEPRLDEWSNVILVGTVVEEIAIQTELVTSASGGGSFVIKPTDTQALDPAYAIFQATVHVQAVLKGEWTEEELRLPILSDVWQCLGGPRLHEGERVLLLIHQSPTWTSHGEPRDVIWETGPAGGNVRFEGGLAYLDDYQSDLGSELGDAVALINYVADAVDASNESRAAALAALSAPVAGAKDGFDWLPMTVGLLIVGGAGVVGLLLLRRRYTARG